MNWKDEARSGILSCLGFFDGPVPVGSIASITSRPQLMFKPIRLFVVEECRHFSITDIRIGCRSQLVNNQPIPAEAFTRCHGGKLLEIVRHGPHFPLAPPKLDAVDDFVRAPWTVPKDLADDVARIGEHFKCETAQVAMDVTIWVKNNGDASRVFQAAMFGVTIE